MSKKSIVIMHLSFWLVYIIVGTVIDEFGSSGGVFKFQDWLTSMTAPYILSFIFRGICIFYLSYWYFDRFFSLDKAFPHFIVGLLFAFVGVLYRMFINDILIAPRINEWNWGQNLSLGYYLGRDYLLEVIPVLSAFFLKSIKDLVESEQLKKEKIATELAYLKSQINPHFLFNTMNNLYGLSLSEPEKTPDVILKVSAMMRYMLYESNEELVLLTKEVEYLNSYIELEKIRYEGQTYIDFTVEGNITNKLIPPILLISFVENIFKHGDIQSPQNAVEISLKVEDRRLIFKQKNKTVIREKDKMGGLGLKNVERRLSLLYPGKHSVNVKNTNGIYESELILTYHD
jgi:two-component system, LytTR family, sensor kinase